MENRSKNFSFAVLVLVAFAVGDFAAVIASDPATEPAASITTQNSTQVANGGSSQASPVPTHDVASGTSAAAENSVGTPALNTATSSIQTSTNSTNMTLVDIYYEGLCNDSVKFMEKQFKPVYEKLNRYISVTFIPFAQGKIEQNDSLVCKRDGECDVDKVHTCAIEYIKRKDDLVNFITCALTEGNKNTLNSTVDKCGLQSKIENTTLTSINTCVSDSSIYLPLLKKDLALTTPQNITSVPRIVFNKMYSNKIQNLAESDFLSALCSSIEDKPDECKKINNGSSTIVVGILPILISVYYFIRMF